MLCKSDLVYKFNVLCDVWLYDKFISGIPFNNDD